MNLIVRILIYIPLVILGIYLFFRSISGSKQLWSNREPPTLKNVANNSAFYVSSLCLIVFPTLSIVAAVGNEESDLFAADLLFAVIVFSAGILFFFLKTFSEYFWLKMYRKISRAQNNE